MWIAVAGVVCLIVAVIWVVMVYVARLRTWRAALCGTCIACLVGSVVGSAMVYIAMDHNAQEEFISGATGTINYAGLSEIFLSWSVVISVAASLVLALAAWTARGLGMLYGLLRA
jgi:hypothetical protein